MRILTVFLLSAALIACTSGTGYQYQTGHTPRPTISKVILNNAFQIRPDRASEYIQYGEIMPRNKVVEYYPHCVFELRTVIDIARTVQPETFTVTGIRRDRDMAGFRHMMVAGGGGDYNLVVSTTVIQLISEQQPDVFRLSCMQLDEPYRARHVSTEAMRKTLGDYFTLE